MTKTELSKELDNNYQIFAQYTTPVVVLDANNIICYANDLFFIELKLTRDEIIGRKNINELSVSSSDKQFGLLESSKFLNKIAGKVNNFIVFKEKGGRLRYFFYKMSRGTGGRKILFLFDHSVPLESMDDTMNKGVSFRQVMNAFPGVIIVFNNSFKIIEVNASGDIDLVSIFDISTGKSLQESSLPDSLKATSLKYLKQCRREEKDVSFDYNLTIGKGLRNFRCRFVYRKKHIFALISDVTEEFQVVQNLINRQKELQDIVDEMPVAVVQVTESGSIKFKNTPFVELIHRSGLSSSDNIAGYIGRKLFKLLKLNCLVNQQHCVQLGELYVDIANRQRVVDNKVENLIVFVDVSERERNKNALEKSEAKHKMLVDTSPNGIMIRDEETVFYANPEALRILGFKNEKEVDLSKVMSAKDRKAIEQRLKKTKKGIDVEFMDYVIVPKDSKTPITISTKPILVDYQGKPAYQIVFRNSSAEKLLIEERVKKEVLEGRNKKLTNEIARRVEIESKLNKTIDENRVLINEVHHRVKNNYQVISSMLNRYTSNITDPASLKAIKAVKGRLVSMAIVNDFYMDAENYNSILLINYLDKIYQNFVRENGSVYTVHKIIFNTAIRNLVVDLNEAVPIGLIFNEILTILYQLVDKLSDNFCNFVSLKWQHKNTLMFTVRFHQDLSNKLAKEFDTSIEMSSMRDLLEQVDGYIVNHFEKAELQLIVKLQK